MSSNTQEACSNCGVIQFEEVDGVLWCQNCGVSIARVYENEFDETQGFATEKKTICREKVETPGN